MSAEENQIVVGITGASGSLYGIRLVHALLGRGCQVTLLLSDAGRQVLQHELEIEWPLAADDATRQIQTYFASNAIRCVAIDAIGARIASGSAAPKAMVVAPCSMGTAGRIAAGLSSNLMERAADVMLKEQRPLILVPRETPFSTIHLENLLRLARVGATILPAAPAFYHKPDSLEALVDFIVSKILDQLAIPHKLFRPWEGQ